MKINYFLVLALALSGCGKEGAGLLELRIQFPDSLKKGGARYQRFLSQAEFMEIRIKSSGKDYENRFPPMQWESIQLPLVEADGKGVDVVVRIWDRTKDGKQRNYPVLEGKKKISVEALNGKTPSLVKLALKITPENFD
jgi:hypothetical protein